MKLSIKQDVFLAVTCALYLLLQQAGLFAAKAMTLRETLFSIPFLAGATLLGVHSLALFWARRGGIARREWLAGGALWLLVISLWTSYFCRVELKMALAEGQPYAVNFNEPNDACRYLGRFASFPDLYIKPAKLTPEFSADRRDLKKITAEFMLLTRDGKAPDILKKTAGETAVRSGFKVRFSGLGYAVRYVLKGKNGEQLDSAFVQLKLFPPGSEDIFRLMSPHTYYLRYYPDGSDGTREPTVRLRVSRNKDLVLSRTLKVNEEATFDDQRISFAEVRYWTTFQAVKDPGEYPLFAAIASLAAWVFLTARARLTGETS